MASIYNLIFLKGNHYLLEFLICYVKLAPIQGNFGEDWKKIGQVGTEFPLTMTICLLSIFVYQFK